MYCVIFSQHSLCISIFLLLYTIKHIDGCKIPAILQNANWNYDFDNKRATLTFTSSGMTGLQYIAGWETLNTYKCIANTDDVYVFISDSYSDKGAMRWIYLCMKMTEVTENLYYFYLLADISTSVTPNDRVHSLPHSTVLGDNNMTCATFCSHASPISDNDARPLQREGTNDVLTGGETLCGTCASQCASPDGCTIPAILQSANWNYDFDNRTATLTFTSSGMTGLQYRIYGENLITYNCIADTDEVYVFKSSESYSDKGQSRWIYLCMKMTKVTENLHYFYLLADIYTGVTPNDRVYSPPADPVLSDNSPPCVTFCSYTTTIPDNDARPLQREGTNETLPGGEIICGMCVSPCANTTDSPGYDSTTSIATDGTTETLPGGEILCRTCALHCANTNNGTTETLPGGGILCCTCGLYCANTNNGTHKTLPGGETLCGTCASPCANTDDGTTETLPGGEILCRICALLCANTNIGTTETLPGGEIICRMCAFYCANTNNGTTETLPDGEILCRTYALLCANTNNGLSYVGISGMCYVLVLLAKLVI